MSGIRRCHDHERKTILEIVNAAAEAYRGVIPADRWHEPYMQAREIDEAIAAGVSFWGYEANGSLVSVIGIQPVRDVDLIRHAYVLPGSQRLGIGSALLEDLRPTSTRRMLVGTWAAADWAIRRRLGDSFLRTSRLRAGSARAHRFAASELLDDPRAPDRDIRGPRGPSAERRVRRLPAVLAPAPGRAPHATLQPNSSSAAPGSSERECR